MSQRREGWSECKERLGERAQEKRPYHLERVCSNLFFFGCFPFFLTYKLLKIRYLVKHYLCTQ